MKLLDRLEELGLRKTVTFDDVEVLYHKTDPKTDGAVCAVLALALIEDEGSMLSAAYMVIVDRLLTALEGE